MFRMLSGKQGAMLSSSGESPPESPSASVELAIGDVREGAPTAQMEEAARVDAGAWSSPIQNTSDGALAYQLFLGRNPENEVVAEALIGADPRNLAERFLQSVEFESRFIRPLEAGRAPLEWHSLPLGERINASLFKALDVPAEALAKASTWDEVHGCLFRSPIARGVLTERYREAAAPLLARVDDAYTLLSSAGSAAERALSGLRPLVRGLELISCRDLVIEEGGSFRALSNDSWICASPTKREGRLSSFGKLTIEATLLDCESVQAKVYLDYGSGFNEAHTLSGELGNNGRRTFVLAALNELKSLRVDITDTECAFELRKLSFEYEREFNSTDARQLLSGSTMTDAIDDFYDRRAIRRAFERLSCEQIDVAEALNISRLLSQEASIKKYGSDYLRWIELYERPDADDYATMKKMIGEFGRRPFFSFVMPTYNTPIDLLKRCVESMLDQVYEDLEICIADDHSSDSQVTEYLEGLAKADKRVKFVARKVNGHISEASNSALALATGEFIVLVDHDDEIPDYCLFVVAEAINRHPDAKILFSDEDKIDINGNRSGPYFKGQFNRFLMLGHNMVSHLGVYERDLVSQVGGFRKCLEGSQDYDLFLRCFEKITPEQVVHIPHVLYHWRMIPGSTAMSSDQKSYAIVAAAAAINGHLERTGAPLRSVEGFNAGATGIGVTRTSTELISIIIPTRDMVDLLRPCIDSVVATLDERIEIIVVDNDSRLDETKEYLAWLEEHGIARVIPWPHEFNYSLINNIAVEAAKGEIVCFLNNDTEVLAPRWLDRARALLSMSEVGAVGARLIYPDGILQHFGIVLGMGDHRIAGTPHGGMPADVPGYLGKARLMAEFSAASAACLFMRRADFNAIGGFDPGLAVAYNDVDLCLKIRERGLKIICDPEILLVHKESRTRGSDKTGERAKRLAADAELLRSRWARQLEEDPYYSPNLTISYPDLTLAWPPRVPMPWLAPKLAEISRSAVTSKAGTAETRLASAVSS